MHTEKKTAPYYGLMAEFTSEAELVSALHKVHDAGYHHLDAYSPYPVEEVFDILHLHKNKVPLAVLIGGICGAIGGYFMEYWCSVISYPWNIGGRPLNSIPAFIPVAYETTILCAAFGAVIGMLWMNNLPEPYHPVFNVPGFENASIDRFFICIESHDPKFDLEKTEKFLEGLSPVKVSRVEH